MDMTGERRIPATRQAVWTALNDPDVLKASIPGCKSLEKTSDTDLKATAAIKIGPISAQFTGKVQLLDLDPPNSYRIAGEGQGGVAGFANGGAKVSLSDDGAFTVLSYEVKAQVGGKIAQLGDLAADLRLDLVAEHGERAILASRLPDLPPRLAAQVVAFVQHLRQAEMFKLPGVAETIDWANALTHMNQTELTPEAVDDTLGVLVKYQDDIAKVRGEMAARLVGDVQDAA